MEIKMISITEKLSPNELAFMSYQPQQKVKQFGKVLSKGAGMSRELAGGFGGTKKEYQRSFERRGLKRLGYQQNVKYLGAATARKVRSIRKAA